MRKIIMLIALTAFTAGMVLITQDDALARRREKKEDEAEPAQEVVLPAMPQEEPKLIYSFKNKEEMAEFEQLYIAKQATFGRMGVLQAYFSMEQNNLTEVDRQMEEKFKFKMAPDKMYDLNREALELKEIGAIPQQAPPPQQ